MGRVLGATGAVYVHEPDNHLVLPEAWAAKQGLGPFPALIPGEPAPAYEQLWALAFAGGGRPSLRYSSARLVHRAVPRSGRGSLVGTPDRAGTLRLAGTLATRRAERGGHHAVVAKSVFCARAVEWLSAAFEPQVVVTDRHPFAVIRSWATLGWESFLDADPGAVRQCEAWFGVSPPAPGAAWIERAAWHYGFLTAHLQAAVVRHPEWSVVSHETLCADPPGGFRHLAANLGLGWDDEAERFLLASNRRGRGYSTNRVWAEEVDGWHTRLDPDDQELVMSVLDRFSWAPLSAANPQPTR